MEAKELAEKMQGHASNHYGDLCGILWDGGAMIRKQAAEIESLRAQLAARVPTIHSVMDLAKAIHATKTGADEWEALRQWEVDVFRQSAEAIMKQLGPGRLSAAPSQPAPHPDDVAVDRFAEAMKQKLGMARVKGRGGWQTCSKEDLSRMLREHVEKGDPRDVANFCMFLYSLGHGIAQQAPVAQGEPVAWMWQHEETGRTGFVDAWQVEQGWQKNNPRNRIVGPLYTTPQQASEPMTVEQIWENDQLMALNAVMGLPMQTIESIVGIVERHHQIKGKQ
jgi:hypothetical protein